MADLGVWVLSRGGGGGGAPEDSRMAAAMELQQGQKDAMAPPLFLDFAHGGNPSEAPAWLCFCKDFVFLCFSALLSDGERD
jgi:hypothetical protein